MNLRVYQIAYNRSGKTVCGKTATVRGEFSGPLSFSWRCEFAYNVMLYKELSAIKPRHEPARERNLKGKQDALVLQFLKIRGHEFVQACGTAKTEGYFFLLPFTGLFGS